MHQTLESRFVQRERGRLGKFFHIKHQREIQIWRRNPRTCETDVMCSVGSTKQRGRQPYNTIGWCARGDPSIRMAEAVGLSMSKICSAYRIADGLYFWSANLCVNEWGAFSSWRTGW
ncbi:hypothetical protein Hanom_Chr04g00286491 [Helianthus anomalus]